MFRLSKHPPRRQAIRNDRPDRGLFWIRIRAEGVLASVGVAILFCALVSTIVATREQVVGYRPGQYIGHDLVSRVEFTFRNRDLLTSKQREAREKAARVYRHTSDDPWDQIEKQLLSLPDLASAGDIGSLPEPLAKILDTGAMTRLQQYRSEEFRAGFEQSVRKYCEAARALRWVILSPVEYASDKDRVIELVPYIPGEEITRPARKQIQTLPLPENLRNVLREKAVQNFALELQGKVVAITLDMLRPTHANDPVASAEAANRAAEAIPADAADERKPANMVLVPAGRIEDRDWQLLKAENDAYLKHIDRSRSKGRFGLIGLCVLLTVVLSAYVALYQPRIVRNPLRAAAVGGLLLAMLLLSQLAGVGNSSLYFFGVAPTILAAMILATAYDRRFAMGVSSMHAILTTIGLGQGVPFYVILWVGVLVTCFLLNEIRTRSKLIEVGGAASIAMMAVTFAAGLAARDPLEFIGHNCLYSGAAGLVVGGIVLSILPFVEKAFKITTAMTLLELADMSRPLLRRLSVEAPGTYNHSLQVGTLAEEATEAIGGNSLLARVASYYHDVGKINKADYFVENQSGGQNRHLNLSPSVSLLIIIGHVKDGVELAREYNLPNSILPFIQQHHGTTLVEYFYHQAREQNERTGSEPQISEMQYRYPGPKPKTREIAVVMLSDAAESATRAMHEPNPERIGSLVNDLARKRLLDGQFDECDMTLRDLDMVKSTLVKTLIGIYHGRIAYPSMQDLPGTGMPQRDPAAVVRSA